MPVVMANPQKELRHIICSPAPVLVSPSCVQEKKNSLEFFVGLLFQRFFQTPFV
jgi:hypothetical protein